MLFHEIYGCYYNAVAEILHQAVNGALTEKGMQKIVTEKAFSESFLTVVPSLKDEKWQLLKKDLSTPIKHEPSMPLTDLQKRWLKAISLDPRVKLFDVDLSALDGVEPLFTPEDYVIYDKYADGDPYEDEGYIERFKTVLTAIKTGQNIRLEMTSRKGKTVYVRCVPERIEYSEKDDKFRLVTSGCGFVRTVNMARITKCRLYSGDTVIESEPPEAGYEDIVLKVSEERNTLERCMLHFAHFEKRAEKADGHYRLHIRFQKDDEPEMVIRVLSFGPLVEVLESENFKNLIIDKLKAQKAVNFNVKT